MERPALVVLFFVGLVPLAGFIPPPAPSDSAQLIASWYQDHTTAIQIGVLVMVTGTAFNATFGPRSPSGHAAARPCPS